MHKPVPNMVNCLLRQRVKEWKRKVKNCIEINTNIDSNKWKIYTNQCMIIKRILKKSSTIIIKWWKILIKYLIYEIYLSLRII